MYKMISTALGSLLILHDPLSAEILPLNELHWDVSDAQAVEFKEIHGRDALCFGGGGVLFKDKSLGRGILSVDIENTHHRHFGYLSFLAVDAENAEEVYLRMHKSRQLDAVQYNPHINDEPNWQLLGHAQTRADFGADPWVTLQVEFDQTKAVATVASSAGETKLQINELLLGKHGERFGLRALFPTCFSNFRVIEGEPDLSGILPPVHDTSPSVIRNWRLSPQSRFEQFPDQVWSGEDWQDAEADPSGTLMISRYIEKASSGNFGRNDVDLVFASTEIHSDSRRTVAINFDLSDVGRVYLNGDPVFEVDNSIRAKGNALFRGDFSPSAQKLFLDLQPGENELIFAVAERTNGWGLAAKVENAEGLSFR